MTLTRPRYTPPRTPIHTQCQRMALGALMCASWAQAQAQEPTVPPASVQTAQVTAATDAAQATPSEASPESLDLQVPASYKQAMQSLAQGQFDQAEQQLQATLRSHPEWAGAWLDLAVLAMRQKRYPQAQELLLIMAQKFSPLPEGIRQTVNQLNTQIEQHLQAQDPGEKAVNVSAPQTAISLATGFDTNANAGLHTAAVTLTLPNANTASLPIDAASQAQSAAYTRLGLSRQSQNHVGRSQITWHIQAQARHNQGLSEYDSLELLPQATLVHPQLPGQLSVAWQSAWLHGKSVVQSPMLRWHYGQPLGQCQWQNQVQTEQRHYSQAPHLDSHWHAYRSTLDCPNPEQRSKIHLQFAQENAATDLRPGGNTQHHSLGLQHEWFNAGGNAQHTLQLRLELQRANDSQGYNSLLENGQSKQLKRIDLQFSWSAPVPHPSTWRWSMALNFNSQKSNIELFNKYNKTLELGFWRVW